MDVYQAVYGTKPEYLIGLIEFIGVLQISALLQGATHSLRVRRSPTINCSSSLLKLKTSVHIEFFQEKVSSTHVIFDGVFP